MDVKAPRCLTLLGDWSNILAGISLTVSFSILCAVFTFKVAKMDEGSTHEVFLYTMTMEGILWAVGGATLAAVNVIEKNALLAVIQTIIGFGGCFFAISGLGDGLPGNIISITYVIPISDPADARIQDALPFWGISCFMFATTLSLRSVWAFPKNRIISPFWGIACFFLGAWTIGVFGLWGPCLADGIVGFGDLKDKSLKYNLPPYSWTWIHVFQVLGALFLTAGAVIFGALDGIFGGRRGAVQEFSDEESISDSD
mmetsp:Transcript_12800/g.36348  ORF Transcript_12800/g.36348 Transcript_12800/m.36348 type:complete len:256 (+) Transcript_12800:56-823(+)